MFEPPSDEEIYHKSDTDSEEEGEGEAQVSDEEENVRKDKKSQSPWDFSSYTESLADEHSRRRTTSVDYKISKALERRSVAVAGNDDSDEDSDPQLQLQVMLSSC